MKPGIKSDTAKSAKSLAGQAAKQIAQEPLEILKQAGKQLAGEGQKPMEVAPPTVETRVFLGVPPEEKKRIQTRDTRLLQALEEEIKDIRKQKEMEEQKRIEQLAPQVAPKPLVEPSTKRSRKLFSFGPKAQAERQKTRVERPLPPSG